MLEREGDLNSPASKYVMRLIYPRDTIQYVPNHLGLVLERSCAVQLYASRKRITF